MTMTETATDRMEPAPHTDLAPTEPASASAAEMETKPAAVAPLAAPHGSDDDDDDDDDSDDDDDESLNVLAISSWDRALVRGLHQPEELSSGDAGCYSSRKAHEPSYVSEYHFGPVVIPNPPIAERVDLNKKLAVWHGHITSVKADGLVVGVYPYRDDVQRMVMEDGRIAQHPWGEDVSSVAPAQVAPSRPNSLPARHLFWVKVPQCEDSTCPNPPEVQALEQCYINALNTAVALGCKTLVLPVLGSGDSNFPYVTAATAAVRATRQWLEEHAAEVDMLLFVSYPLPNSLQTLVRALKLYFPGKGDATMLPPPAAGCTLL